MVIQPKFVTNKNKFIQMKKLYDLSGLFLEYLKDMYSAEKQQIEYLPKFLPKLENSYLKKLVEQNLNDTKNHEKRIETIFTMLKDGYHLREDLVMEELLGRLDSLLKYSDNCEILDASFISSMQNIVHYEIATYGTLKSLAATLNYKTDIIDLLKKSLEEEKWFDIELTKLARENVNLKAKGFFLET